jgi:hypothetical protein
MRLEGGKMRTLPFEKLDRARCVYKDGVLRH